MIEDDDIILRTTDEESNSHKVGIMSRRPQQRVRHTPPPKPDVIPLTNDQKVRRVARRVVDTTVKTTEDEANAKALELISNAAVRLERNSRIVRKPKSAFSVGKALAQKLEELLKRGNG